MYFKTVVIFGYIRIHWGWWECFLGITGFHGFSIVAHISYSLFICFHDLLLSRSSWVDSTWSRHKCLRSCSFNRWIRRKRMQHSLFVWADTFSNRHNVWKGSSASAIMFSTAEIINWKMKTFLGVHACFLFPPFNYLRLSLRKVGIWSCLWKKWYCIDQRRPSLPLSHFCLQVVESVAQIVGLHHRSPLISGSEPAAVKMTTILLLQDRRPQNCVCSVKIIGGWGKLRKSSPHRRCSI